MTDHRMTFRTWRKRVQRGRGVAYTPAPSAAMASRVTLLVRAMLVLLRIAWVNFIALCGVVAALLPLVPRHRPLGVRRAPPRPDAPVLPIPPRRIQNR